MEELPLFPVAGFEISQWAERRAIIVRFQYLASPADSPDSPHQGLRHLLTVKQAREIAASLERAARIVESGAPPATG